MRNPSEIDSLLRKMLSDALKKFGFVLVDARAEATGLGPAVLYVLSNELGVVVDMTYYVSAVDGEPAMAFRFSWGNQPSFTLSDFLGFKDQAATRTTFIKIDPNQLENDFIIAAITTFAGVAEHELSSALRGLDWPAIPMDWHGIM